MKALITGGTSGIGLSIAKVLDEKGYDLILVGNNKSVDESLFKNKVKSIKLDLSKRDNCYKLYEMTKDEDIDVFINNAGFGLFGSFDETSLDTELNMIDVNICAAHILMKLYLKDMIKKDRGYILNTASAAAFAYGPLLSTYYSTKSYLYKLTLAIYEELKKKNSKVNVSVLCPGPVNTNFNDRANVTFTVKSLDSDYVGEYAVKKMFKKKLVIIPGLSVRLSKILLNLLPLKLVLKICYTFQKRKDS